MVTDICLEGLADIMKDRNYPLVTQALMEFKALRDGIRKHRDYHGDDRCWMDDEELYRLLPEGYTPPERDTAVELRLCEQYISRRRNPATTYVSPQRRIEELEREVKELQEMDRLG